MYPSYSAYSAQGWEGGGKMTSHNPDDPGAASPQYWQMWARWVPVADVLAGTQSMRQNSMKYLPRLCNESDACYQTRINRSVLSPLFHRVLKAAVGLIMRKPIVLEGGDEKYWEEWRKDVDRQGSSLDEFIGKIVYSAIAYGHCGVLVDYPSNEARNLREERELNARPYFIMEQAPNIIGWRHSATEGKGQLQQVRLREVITEPDGRFGTEINRQIRVMEPGKFEVWKESEYGSNSYKLDASGGVSVSDIPLAVVYSERQQVLMSEPPLEELAHLNIQHYQLQASLLNSLHVAGFPLLVLKAWDDSSNELQNLSVGNALALPPEGDASYVEPASSAFDAMQTELKELEHQIGTLGITMLARPKNVAESGTAKALDRADSNSMLAQISINVEMALQDAINWAAEYAGVKPPVVGLIRDFNAEELDPGTMTQMTAMYNAGILDKETVLKMLQRGEVLDDSIDLAEVMELTEQQELDDLAKEVDRMTELSKIGEGGQPKNNAGQNKPAKIGTSGGK